MANVLASIEGSLRWIPSWFVSLMVLFLAGLVALVLHRYLFSFAQRAVAEKGLFWRSLISRTKWPTRMVFIIIGLTLGTRIAPLGFGQAGFVRQLLLVCFIVTIAWIAQSALHIWSIIYMRRFKLEAEDNLLARKHATQSKILLRVADILILIIAISAVLMTIEEVRQYGVSLLASAGAAGIIVGLALQPVLKNLLAGIQLAITQPIRIDDALIVEGEWGNVEEITSTYVVLRIWDMRRLIVPLSYFIEQPFQNWTREGSALLGTVIIFLDYRAPLDAIRGKVEEIAKASPLWNGEVAHVQVTDLKADSMEIRILVSANNSGKAFDLRCEVREKLIDFLQREHAYALPVRRLEQSGTQGLSQLPSAG
ncbi:mechanosensitive ion channel family protein [Pelagibacterium luteolum]|uniref:Small-conductance mechanosensitive channel n=1 Tax=Pelagibacterium luteolum TaxID=440168 RepID=A0A1G7XP44_9HYPH|nr:mechanosensitive ion channel domain-containing protein [Pelagibacterium luteolum]SDG85967.1 Small-conductance mechanosensitive channel [Pelagibacterium luteolum]